MQWGGQSLPSILTPNLIVLDIRTPLLSGPVVSVYFMKLYRILTLRFISARSGFLWPPSLRLHHFCSHNGAFDKAVGAQRAISQTAFYRRWVHVIRTIRRANIPRSYRPSLLRVCNRSAVLGNAMADRLYSVIWNLNLVNVIILFVRHFLSGLCPINLSPFCSAPPLGDRCKPLQTYKNSL